MQIRHPVPGMPQNFQHQNFQPQTLHAYNPSHMQQNHHHYQQSPLDSQLANILGGLQSDMGSMKNTMSSLTDALTKISSDQKGMSDRLDQQENKLTNNSVRPPPIISPPMNAKSPQPNSSPKYEPMSYINPYQVMQTPSIPHYQPKAQQQQKNRPRAAETTTSGAYLSQQTIQQNIPRTSGANRLHTTNQERTQPITPAQRKSFQPTRPQTITLDDDENLFEILMKKIKPTQSRPPSEYRDAIRSFIKILDRQCHKLNIEAPKNTIEQIRVQRNHTNCQFWQTGDCKDPNPTHGTYPHFYQHFCDICCRIRNAFLEHAAEKCEIIIEIERVKNSPSYNPVLLKFLD